MWVTESMSWDKFKSYTRSQNKLEAWDEADSVLQLISGRLKSPAIIIGKLSVDSSVKWVDNEL